MFKKVDPSFKGYVHTVSFHSGLSQGLFKTAMGGWGHWGGDNNSSPLHYVFN